LEADYTRAAAALAMPVSAERDAARTHGRHAGGPPRQVRMARMKPEKQTLHYVGRVVRLTTDEVVLPNGHRTQLEVVHHSGGAAVAALDAEGRVCLLRQYRYVADGYLWELPAGKLEPQEAPLATAQRELAEEAGARAARWHSLGVCLSSPGVFTERIHLYLARGLTPAAAAHERSEVIEVHWVALEQACDWALDGTIDDMKTALGLLRARNMSARVP
jgi:8-oxo-dGTP pyrophosphatase MutT (NUDIX family)